MSLSPRDTETLTLYTRPFEWKAPGQLRSSPLMPARMVVEIMSNRMPTVRQNRFGAPQGELIYWDLTLPTSASKLLIDFFNRTMTYEYKPVRYECHSLSPYIYGVEESILPLPRQNHTRTYGDPVSPDNLIAGQPYVLQNVCGEATHAVLGVNETETSESVNLSVLGGNGPLAITGTHYLCETYNSPIVRPIIYAAVGSVATRQNCFVQD